MKKKILFAVVGALIIVVLGFLISRNARIGTAAYQDVRDLVRPQFMPVGNKEKIDVLAKSFSDDIDIGIVVDAPEKYTFVKPDDLKTWGVTEQQLYDQALKNLETISKDTKVQLYQSGTEEKGKYILLELPDGYTAARLLSPTIRKTVASELGDTYLAAIPTRDFMIFWREDFPFAAEFLKQVNDEYTAETKYPLSPNLFVISPAGIQPVKAVPK